MESGVVMTGGAVLSVIKVVTQLTVNKSAAITSK